MSTGLAERSYTEAEIEAMDTPDLLALYKRTGDETLKWPLVLRYEGLIDSAVSHLANELGRCPTDQEGAGHLGIPTDKYQKEAARVALSNTLSLDALMDARDMEGGRFELSDQDPKLQPETVLEDRELQETLAAGISSLQENEQIVLSLYYEKNLHMKEIAQVMGVSEPRISQIHSRAIQKNVQRLLQSDLRNGHPAAAPERGGQQHGERVHRGLQGEPLHRHHL